jgi:hypothetical protein
LIFFLLLDIVDSSMIDWDWFLVFFFFCTFGSIPGIAVRYQGLSQKYHNFHYIFHNFKNTTESAFCYYNNNNNNQQFEQTSIICCNNQYTPSAIRTTTASATIQIPSHKQHLQL